MNGAQEMPTRAELDEYRSALHAIAAAADSGRRVTLTGAQLAALERITAWRRARSRGTYGT